MPEEDNHLLQETILRGNISMDVSNTNSNATPLLNKQSPDTPSDCSSSSVIKSNLSQSNKQKSEMHRVTFSESHSVKEVGSGDVTVIHNNTATVFITPGGGDDAVNYTAESSQHGDTHNWPGGGAESSGRPLFLPQTELQSKPLPPPILRITRSPSTDSHENPFQDDGPLSKKADYIVRNSTISRTELKIADPDQLKLQQQQQQEEEQPLIAEQAIKSESAPTQHASPPRNGDMTDGPARPNNIKVKENGNVDEPLTPQSVEVEVGKANASQPEAQQAEEVKLPKNKKCKCCVLQ